MHVRDVLDAQHRVDMRVTIDRQYHLVGRVAQNGLHFRGIVDGEFDELMPLIMNTLKLGFRQLGLAIGPALLATIPVLFLIAWVAGQFGYQFPGEGEEISVTAIPETAVVMVEAAGGEYLTRDGQVDVLVGDWNPSRVVIFKWPNQAKLDAFMSSEEYQPWKALRESVTTTKTLVRVVGEGHQD